MAKFYFGAGYKGVDILDSKDVGGAWIYILDCLYDDEFKHTFVQVCEKHSRYERGTNSYTLAEEGY